MASLALFYKGLRLNYLVATALAVEVAVLHNFLWHERFTWKDRKHSGLRDRLLRLVRFHAGNGVVSIAGNVVLMRLLVGGLHLHYLIANGISIAICSFLNFAIGEWFVFRR
jgi:putative flippase GtrA